jgi:DNA adenine methylase
MPRSNKQSSYAPLLAGNIGGKQLPSPPLKWAGGKSQLLPTLEQFLPPSFNRYFEPFVGGGAMFFRLWSADHKLSATLADANAELINCYKVIATDVDRLIEELKKHKNDKDYFYAIRSLDTHTLDSYERAARLIYLNKTCFNGLYRVNSRGQFNVPFGSYKNPKTCDEDNLRAVAAALRKADLKCALFAETLRGAKKDDFVYLDPPYQPISATSNFTGYTSLCFGEQDQKRLADAIKQLDKRGCYFMLSNSDNDLIRRLYKGFKIETVQASRAINCRGDRRGKITELVVRNY